MTEYNSRKENSVKNHTDVAQKQRQYEKNCYCGAWYGDNIPGGAEAALRGITDHLFAAGMDIEILTTTVEKFTADWNKDFYKPGSYTSKNGIPIRRF